MSVLLIDPFSSGHYYPQLLRAARVEYHVVRTQRALDSGLADDSTPIPLALDHAVEEHVASLMDLCATHHVNTVLTGTESGVPLAEALKYKLGSASRMFRDHGRRYWDKILLYSTLAKAGLRVPRMLAVFDAADVHSGEVDSPLLHALRYPALVKPDVGAGSVGVRVVTTPQDCREAIRDVVTVPGFFRGASRRAIVQEYVEGREYVIDTFSQNGRHRGLSVCTYDKHRSSKGAMIYDRLRWLDWHEGANSRLIEYAFDVLNALDHREGSVHMEVIVTDHGPCLVDLGARPHGAGHPMKTFELTGTSQLHAEVAAAAGLPAPPQRCQMSTHAAIEFFSLDGPARVRDEARPTELLMCENVLSGSIPAKPGSSYGETQSLLDSEQLGLVFITGASENEVAITGRALREAFARLLETVSDAP